MQAVGPGRMCVEDVECAVRGAPSPAPPVHPGDAPLSDSATWGEEHNQTLRSPGPRQQHEHDEGITHTLQGSVDIVHRVEVLLVFLASILRRMALQAVAALSPTVGNAFSLETFRSWVNNLGPHRLHLSPLRSLHVWLVDQHYTGGRGA